MYSARNQAAKPTMFSLNVVLWAIGSLAAVSVLMGLMRRRRDYLVGQLRDYVSRELAAERRDNASEKKE